MFDFNKAYRVMTHETGKSATLLGVAVGIRPFSDLYPEPFEAEGIGHGFEWIPNSPIWPVRRAFLDVVSDSSDRVEAKEKMAEFSGNDVTYVFEPLTVARLAEVKNDILGFDAFVSDLASDEDIQEFYRDTWLRKDWSPTAQTEEWVWADQIEEEIEEGLAYPVGKRTHRGDGHVWQKMPNLKWVRLGKSGEVRRDPEEGPEEEEDEEEIVRAAVGPLIHVVSPGHWIEHAEGLPSSTFLAHFEEDPTQASLPDEYDRMRPTERRRRLHRLIERQFHRDNVSGRASVPADQAPVAVLTMGVPASGKSTAVKRMVSLKEFVHIDQDQIKEYIPEYQNALMQRARNAANLVQTESSYLADQFRDRAIEDRMNFVFEGVGRDPEYYMDLIGHLRESGYRIQLVFPHVEDVEGAIQTSTERAEKSGRWVSPDYIRHVAPLVPKNFMALKDLVDDFAVFDGDQEPRPLAWALVNGQEVVPDPKVKERIEQRNDEQLRMQLRRNAEELRRLATLHPDLGDDLRATHTEAAVRILPPAVAASEIISRFVKAYEVDYAAIQMLPKQFTADQGTTETPDDPKSRRYRAKLHRRQAAKRS